MPGTTPHSSHFLVQIQEWFLNQYWRNGSSVELDYFKPRHVQWEDQGVGKGCVQKILDFQIWMAWLPMLS